MLRRDFLKSIFGVIVGGSKPLGICSSVFGMAQNRVSFEKSPNILWILTDDQRWDSLHCYKRHSWVKSPNLDNLAKEGVMFTQAFCQSPACGPSRHSIFTGQYPHQSGVYGFEDTHDQNSLSFPFFTDLLRNRNYNLACFGKDGHMRQKTKNDKGDWIRYRAFPGKSNYRSYPEYYMKKGRAAGTSVELFEGGKKTESELGIIRRPGELSPIIAGTNPLPAGKTVDDFITNDCIEWINKQASSNKPFFLMAGYHFPHTPVLPPKPYDTMYDPSIIPLPTFSNKELEDMPLQVRKIVEMFPLYKLSKEKLRKVWSHYYGFCSYGDNLIGKLIKAFKTQSNNRPWLIVYTSDQGWHLGEHGMGAKFTWYDDSTRVPLIVASSNERFPKNVKCGDFVELVDLAPTFLQAAGIKVPGYMPGRDLRMTARKKIKPRSFVVGDTYHCSYRAMIRTNINGRRWFFSMRTRPDNFTRGKDINWATKAELEQLDVSLYDVKEDSKEIKNLAKEPAYRKTCEKLRRKLESVIFNQRNECRWRNDIKQRATYGM